MPNRPVQLPFFKLQLIEPFRFHGSAAPNLRCGIRQADWEYMGSIFFFSKRNKAAGYRDTDRHRETQSSQTHVILAPVCGVKQRHRQILSSAAGSSSQI